MADNKVVLIGAGNVATHLGDALLRAGYQILQVYSRTCHPKDIMMAKNVRQVYGVVDGIPLNVQYIVLYL